MVAKKSNTEKYWEMLKEQRVKEEYVRYLADEERENNPHNAHLFAIKKIAGGFDYMGIKERDLILLLAGRLPHMYD